MASLIRRNNGTFYIVSCKKHKRVWRSLRTKDELEAKEAFEEYKRDQTKTTVYRLSTFSNEFLQRAHLHVSHPTVGIYKAALGNFGRLCGDKFLRKITPMDVERFKVLRSKEVKPVTVNIDLRTLRAAFNQAKRLRVIEENPCDGMRLIPIEDEEAVFLTGVDIRRLLLVIAKEDFRNLVQFTIHTLMRRGEVVHLEWSDIDLTARMIYIRNKKGFRVKGGKMRKMPMNNWVYAFLVGVKDKQGHVFKNQRGFPLIGASVSKKFKKYVRRAELDDKIHFHSLRHTGITILADKNVPSQMIQRMAGHSSILTTSIYTHYEDRSLLAAINSFPSFN